MNKPSKSPKTTSCSQIQLLKQYVTLCFISKDKPVQKIIKAFINQTFQNLPLEIGNFFKYRVSCQSPECYGCIQNHEASYICTTCDPTGLRHFCPNCFKPESHEKHTVIKVTNLENRLCCCCNDEFEKSFDCGGHTDTEEKNKISDKARTYLKEALSPLVLMTCYCVSSTLTTQRQTPFDSNYLFDVFLNWSTNSSSIKSILTELFTTTSCYKILSGCSPEEVLDLFRISEGDSTHQLFIDALQTKLPPLDFLMTSGVTTVPLFEDSFFDFCCCQFKDPSFFNYFYSHLSSFLLQQFDFIAKDQLPLTEVNKMDSSSDVSFYNSNKLFINYLLKRKSVVHYCPMIQDFIQQAYQYIIDLVNKNKESGLSFPFSVSYKDLYLFVTIFECLTELSSKPEISHLFFCDHQEDECDPVPLTISQSVLLFFANLQEIVTFSMYKKEENDASYSPTYMKSANRHFKLYQEFIYNILEIMRYKVHKCNAPLADVYLPCLYQSLFYIEQYYSRSMKVTEFNYPEEETNEEPSEQPEEKVVTPFDLECKEKIDEPVRRIHYVSVLNLFVEFLFYDLFKMNINFTSLFLHPSLNVLYPEGSIERGLKALLFYIVRVLFADSYYDRSEYNNFTYLTINFGRKDLFHFITLAELDTFLLQVFSMIYSCEYVINVLLHYFSFFTNSFLGLLYPLQTHTIPFLDYDSNLHYVYDAQLVDVPLDNLFERYTTIYENPQLLESLKSEYPVPFKHSPELFAKIHDLYFVPSVPEIKKEAVPEEPQSLQTSTESVEVVDDEKKSPSEESSASKKSKKNKKSKSKASATIPAPAPIIEAPSSKKNTKKAAPAPAPKEPVVETPAPAPVPIPAPVDISSVLSSLSEIGQEINYEPLSQLAPTVPQPSETEGPSTSAPSMNSNELETVETEVVQEKTTKTGKKKGKKGYKEKSKPQPTPQVNATQKKAEEKVPVKEEEPQTVPVVEEVSSSEDHTKQDQVSSPVESSKESNNKEPKNANDVFEKLCQILTRLDEIKNNNFDPDSSKKDVNFLDLLGTMGGAAKKEENSSEKDFAGLLPSSGMTSSIISSYKDQLLSLFQSPLESMGKLSSLQDAEDDHRIHSVFNSRKYNPFDRSKRPINPKTGKPVPPGKKLKQVTKQVPKIITETSFEPVSSATEENATTESGANIEEITEVQKEVMETVIDYEEVDDESGYIDSDGREDNANSAYSLVSHFLYILLSILDSNVPDGSAKEQLYQKVLDYHIAIDNFDDYTINKLFNDDPYDIAGFKNYINKDTTVAKQGYGLLYTLLPHYKYKQSPFHSICTYDTLINSIITLSNMYDRGYPLSFPLMDSLNDSVYRSLLKRNFMYSSSLQKLVFTSISEFCEYSRNDYVSFCESIFLLEMLLELRKSVPVPYVRSPRSIIVIDHLYNIFETYVPEDIYKFLYTDFFISALNVTHSLIYYLLFVLFNDMIPSFLKNHIWCILHHPSCMHTKQDEILIKDYLEIFSKTVEVDIPSFDPRDHFIEEKDDINYRLQNITPNHCCAFCHKGNLEHDNDPSQVSNPLLLLGRVNDTSFEKQNSINGLYMNYNNENNECNSTIPTIVSQSINSFIHIYNNSRYEEEKNKMRSNPMTDFESKKSNYLQFSNKGDNLAFQTCDHYIHKNCLSLYISEMKATSNQKSSYMYCPVCKFQFTIAIPVINQSFYLYNPFVYPKLTDQDLPYNSTDIFNKDTENLKENDRFYAVDTQYYHDESIPEMNRMNRDYMNYKDVFDRENNNDIQAIEKRIRELSSIFFTGEKFTYSNVSSSKKVCQYYKTILEDFPAPPSDFDTVRNGSNVAIIRKDYQYDLFLYLFVNTLKEAEYLTRYKHMKEDIYVLDSYVAHFNCSVDPKTKQTHEYTLLRPMFVNSLKVLLSNVCNVNLNKNFINEKISMSISDYVTQYMNIYSISFLDSKKTSASVIKYFNTFNSKDVNLVVRDSDVFSNMIYMITSFFWRQQGCQMSSIQQVQYVYSYVHKGYYLLYLYQQLQIIKFILSRENSEKTSELLESLQSSSSFLFNLYRSIPLPANISNISSAKIPYYNTVYNEILQAGILDTLRNLMRPFLRKMVLLQLSFTTFYVNDNYFYLPSSYEDCIHYLNLSDVDLYSACIDEDPFTLFVHKTILPKSSTWYKTYLSDYKYFYYLPNINYPQYIRYFDLPKYFSFYNTHTQHEMHPSKEISKCNSCLHCCECKEKKDIQFICLVCGSSICNIQSNSKGFSCLLDHSKKCTNSVVYNTHNNDFHYLGDMRNITFASLFTTDCSNKIVSNEVSVKLTEERYEYILDRITQCTVWGRNGKSEIYKFN